MWRRMGKSGSLDGPESLVGACAATPVWPQSWDLLKPVGWQHSQQLRDNFTEE